MSTVKKIKNKKIIILVPLISLLLVAATALVFKNINSSSSPKPPKDIAPQMNLNAATEEEKDQADQNKQRILERDESIENKPQNNSVKSVSPIITYAGQFGQAIEVGGYVPGIFEEGGVCKATFTLNTSTFTKSVGAVRNASSVDCPTISVGTSEFSQKGSWSVILAYSSNSASGSSALATVEVK